MQRLLELTRKDLVSDVDNATKKRADLVKVFYEGITKDYTVIFRANSVTSDPPTKYKIKIKLVDYPDIDSEEDLTAREKVRLAIAGDLQISCTCPAFLYFGYKYILTQMDTNASDEEHRFPKIRNPKLQGVMCKHSYMALKAFPMHWNTIARDIDKGNFIKG